MQIWIDIEDGLRMRKLKTTNNKGRTISDAEMFKQVLRNSEKDLKKEIAIGVRLDGRIR